MWVFPLAAAVIAVVFAVLLGRQFVTRRRAYQAVWCVAMMMYSAASFALALGVLDGWTTAEYRIYWLFGAVLNVPYLAQGELYLLFRNRNATNGVLIALIFATAFAASQVRTAMLDVGALSRDLPLGREAFALDTLPYRLAQVYEYPAYLFLLAGSVWSVWRMRGRPDLRDRAVGTIWIAVGATIVAIGSGVGAGLNVVPLFSVSLAVGPAVMLWGFVRASRPAPPVRS